MQTGFGPHSWCQTNESVNEPIGDSSIGLRKNHYRVCHHQRLVERPERIGWMDGWMDSARTTAFEQPGIQEEQNDKKLHKIV